MPSAAAQGDISSPWLHGAMSKQDAEQVLLNAKGKDGLFFLRDRTNHPGDYVMCVQFKGKATHHLLRKNEAGFWIINNKQYGKCSTLSEIIDLLSKPHEAWPVILYDFIPNETEKERRQLGSTKKLENPAQNSSLPNGIPKKPQKTDEQHEAATEATALSSAATESFDPQVKTKELQDTNDLEEALGANNLPFYHGKLDRKTAEEIIHKYANEQGFEHVDNIWLLRRRASTDFAITIGFRNKPTHHLIKKSNSTLQINGQETHTSTLSELIEHLNAKPKYWPVELKHPVPALTKAKNVDNIVPSTEATISLENEEQIKTDSLAVTESAENEHITIPVTSTDEVVLDIPDDNQTTATISTEDSSLNKSEQQVVSNELDLITTVAETDANHSSRRTKSFIGCAPEPNNTTPVPHPDLPEDFEALRDLINETPKLPIHLHRKDQSISFGFRLMSTKPPTVSQAEYDGIADQAGLRQGDLILRINKINAMDVEYEHIVSEIKSAELNLTLLAVRPLMMLRKTSITGNKIRRSVGNSSSDARTLRRNYGDSDDDVDYLSDE
eukprot:gene5580-7222_t